MKNLFLAFAVVALLVSCGNKPKQEAAVDNVEETSFEQDQIEENIKLQIDSLVVEFSKMDDTPFMLAIKEGKLELTEAEKQVKPDFLFDPAITNELVALSQKYRAIAVLSADKYIAQIYGQPIDEYEAAIKKMVVDIDDPAFKIFIEAADTATHEQIITDFYNAEKESGRINLFWETTSAYMIEELYLISKDPSGKLIESFTDESASKITYRIALFQNALEKLKTYDPNLNEICDAIKPLEKLNAINVEQMKQQMAEMNNDLQEIREYLLK